MSEVMSPAICRINWFSKGSEKIQEPNKKKQ
jgi:hypothetical protein